MGCSCVRGDDGFNFITKSQSCKLMIYQDLSDWMVTPEHEIPEEYTITIVTPSGFKSSNVVKTGQLNKLTSKELYGVDDICLLDGVYCISTYLCGITYTRYTAFTCNAECELTKFLTNISSPEDIEMGIRIKAYIDAVHASSNQGELNTAKDTYRILKRLIDTLNCKY